MIMWIVGLSGAGKTTIGRKVYEQWKARESNTVLIDGDEVRAIFAQDQTPGDYSLSGRRKNAERITAMCEWLDRQGINVVCCILSVFPDMRAENRDRFSDYFEVYIKVPVDNLIKRDDKGIYGPAMRGETTNVVGVDIPFQEPETSNLAIDNSNFNTPPEEAARIILKQAGIE